ncbi:hypothetical protein ACG59Z_10665 [Acinetobacter sp. ABJ_C1_1]|uniref:hypothetical protein n=1 Tax=Acinetobacter sp. ABJ_C1_1 TaxID=3378321 RepID=UPI0037DC55E4
MKIKSLLIALLTLPLASCFMAQKSALIKTNIVYDEKSQSRIRLYGPYGDKLIKHYNNRTCQEWRSTAGAAIHHRVNNGLPRKIKNISVGIPATERSLAALNDTGVMFRDSFKEYVIEANKPLVLDASSSIVMDSYSKSCRIAVSFIPKAGKNYEAAYVEQGNTCTVRVYEITNQITEKKLSSIQEVSQVENCSMPGDRSI